MQSKKNVWYLHSIVYLSLQKINQQSKSSLFTPPEITEKSLLTERSGIYSKTAMQAVKKSAVQSGSLTQDGQGEKVVKSRWQPRNGYDGRSMAKKNYSNNSGEFCADS